MRRLAFALVAVTGLLLAAASTAHAQPMEEPYEGYEPYPPDTDIDTPGSARLYAPSLGFDLPTRAEQFARSWQELRIARDHVRQTRRIWLRTQNEYRDMLENTPEMREARQELEQARQQLEQAKAALEEQVADNELYTSTLERKRELEAMIAEAGQQDEISRAQRREMAERQLFYGQRLQDLREELANTQPVEEARQRLEQAAAALAQTEAEIEPQLRDVPEVANLRDRHQQAQNFLEDVLVDYAGARAAYNEADFRQVQQDRIRRLRPVVNDPGWRWW